uniref:HTH_Tnp_Tc3_1 domain-containing protein n=1 Tax=Caenorhabditis tropicalis TaxID=1561998 RepID=A0A1I7TPA9_9PELO
MEDVNSPEFDRILNSSHIMLVNGMSKARRIRKTVLKLTKKSSMPKTARNKSAEDDGRKNQKEDWLWIRFGTNIDLLKEDYQPQYLNL